MWAEEELVENQLHKASISGPLSNPRFPAAANGWAYAGPRYQGPNRAFATREATSYEEHIVQPAEPSTRTGHHILPDDLQEAIGFFTHRGAAGIKGLGLKQLSRIRRRANELRPRLLKLRSTADPYRESSRARIRAPLLEGLLKATGREVPNGVTNL